jgi:hypothetical protein
MVMLGSSLKEEDHYQRSHRNNQERDNEFQDGHGLERMPGGGAAM